MVNVGDRVGAILSSSNGVAEFIGYGVYQGREVPSEDAVGMGKNLRKLEIPNPKILLDSGSVVYGYECWWGPEEGVKKELAKMKEVKKVEMSDVRREWTE